VGRLEARQQGKDLVGHAGFIFEGIDDRIARYLFSAQNELIEAISASEAATTGLGQSAR
jgi:hypothetical protein